MAIQWTEDLATGIAEIDSHHKELFRHVDQLLAACNQARGRQEIGKTIAFLENYVKLHFDAEEKRMMQSNYPGFGSHKAQHVFFKNNLLDIKRQIDEEGPGVHIIILTNRLIVDWLRNHIHKLDTAFGSYLQTRQGAAE